MLPYRDTQPHGTDNLITEALKLDCLEVQMTSILLWLVSWCPLNWHLLSLFSDTIKLIGLLRGCKSFTISLQLWDVQIIQSRNMTVCIHMDSYKGWFTTSMLLGRAKEPNKRHVVSAHQSELNTEKPILSEYVSDSLNLIWLFLSYGPC